LRAVAANINVKGSVVKLLPGFQVYGVAQVFSIAVISMLPNCLNEAAGINVFMSIFIACPVHIISEFPVPIDLPVLSKSSIRAFTVAASFLLVLHTIDPMGLLSPPWLTYVNFLPFTLLMNGLQFCADTWQTKDVIEIIAGIIFFMELIC
jgi:hypothetical protein